MFHNDYGITDNLLNRAVRVKYLISFMPLYEYLLIRKQIKCFICTICLQTQHFKYKFDINTHVLKVLSIFLRMCAHYNVNLKIESAWWVFFGLTHAKHERLLITDKLIKSSHLSVRTQIDLIKKSLYVMNVISKFLNSWNGFVRNNT